MDSVSPQLADVLHDLGKSIEALDDHTNAVVLTGGLAVFLYRKCVPDAQVDQPPLTTYDIDWAVPTQFNPPYDVGIDPKLKKAGFIAMLSGSGKNPVTYYQLERHGESRLAPIHVEFIAPRTGSKTDRSGRNQGIIEVERGLHAQTDPYLGLLFAENFTIEASKLPNVGLSENWTIRLPNPLMLAVQKILIRHRRESRKKDNDAAHIFDIAITTRPIWDELALDLVKIEETKQFPGKWFSRARGLFSEVFASPESAGPIGVARIYRDAMGERAAPSEATIHRVVTSFLRGTQFLAE